MNSGVVNLGIVGCGGIAQSHMDACAALPEADLVAVADVDPEAAARAERTFSCRAYTDYRQMLQQEEMEVVCICTPPSTHREICLDAVASGRHVLCEKPFMLTVADAEAVVDLAAQQGVQVAMASKFRFVKDIIRAREMIASGDLGRIVYYENVFCSPVDMAQRWNADREVSGGGVLMDNGPHALDLARYLLGPLAGVRARHAPAVQRLDVEDTTTVQIESASGTVGNIVLSWSIPKQQPVFVEAHGTEGSLRVGWKGSEVCLRGGQWERFGDGYDKQEAFVGQLEHFLECVRNGAEPVITPEDALASVRAVEAAYRSAEVDRWVEVADGSPA